MTCEIAFNGCTVGLPNRSPLPGPTLRDVKHQVLTELTMRADLREGTPCTSERFQVCAKHSVHLQGRRTCQGSQIDFPSISAGLLLGWLFNPEEGGDIFRRNVGLSLMCMELEARLTLSGFFPGLFFTLKMEMFFRNIWTFPALHP